VNSTICKSDIGNKIFDKFPLTDFSAVYSISDHTDDTSFSLRSTNDRADVSEIAFSLGGGGHAQASGVRVNYICNVLPGNVYDNGQLYEELKYIYHNTLDINGKPYNVVYLASSMHKTKLATYLLQNKYKQTQVFTDILTKLGNNCSDRAQIAAVWVYNPVLDITKFTIVLDTSVNTQEKLTINDYFGCDVNYGLICNGLQKFLPTDKKLIVKKSNDSKIES